MRKISSEQYDALLAGSRVLARDDFGDKVILLTAERILKLFRVKRTLSSAGLISYATRFRWNARRLAKRGFCVVKVLDTFRINQPPRTAVIYEMAPGETLRDRLSKSQADMQALLAKLAELLAQLHQSGIVFRSIHFGNVIVDDAGDFTLIDVSDCRFQRRPLSLIRRTRNFHHMLRYEDDRKLFDSIGVSEFLDFYNKTAQLPEAKLAVLNDGLNKLLATDAPQPHL